MQQRTVLLLSFLLAAAFVVRQTQARCNVCTDHGIACISATEFQMCTNGRPNVEQTFTCPAPLVCTDSASKCMKAADRRPYCDPDDTKCGVCTGTKMFVCNSRTSFVQCNGTQVMRGVTGKCPSGLVCDSSTGEICVQECQIRSVLDCANEVPAV